MNELKTFICGLKLFASHACGFMFCICFLSDIKNRAIGHEIDIKLNQTMIAEIRSNLFAEEVMRNKKGISKSSFCVKHAVQDRVDPTTSTEIPNRFDRN